MILFRVKGSQHICEMQIALHMLLTARKEMEAHAAYGRARHFIEVYELATGESFTGESAALLNLTKDIDVEMLPKETQKIVKKIVKRSQGALTKTIAEKNKVIAQKDKALAQKDKTIAQKDKTIAQLQDPSQTQGCCMIS